MNPQDRQTPWGRWWWRYFLGDLVGAALAWCALFVFRKTVVEPRKFGTDVSLELDANFWAAIVVVPLFWCGIHALMGMYVDIRRRHRALEIRQVVRASAGGGVLLFFLLLLDDVTRTHTDHYQVLFVWMMSHTVLVLGLRGWLTTQVVARVQSGEWAFNTLLVGEAEDTAAFRRELEETPGARGWNVLDAMQERDINSDLRALSNWLDDHSVDRAVIATPVSGHESLLGWIAVLEGRGVETLVVPGALDYMAGRVKSTNLFGIPLVNLSRNPMSHGVKALKRFLDLFLSLLALLVLSPVLLFVALWVKSDSDGPVFYRQERLGLFGRPFHIIKFRTMVQNAEGQGPKLSSDADPRITRVGKWLRKTRVDELPQFWNVVKGEMSLVGPRPERAFFADQIVQHSPHFLRLQQVRPGITSWGQVKYGYAENVNEMRQRLRYDIMYLENASLLLDLKILLYTVRTVLRREGK